MIRSKAAVLRGTGARQPYESSNPISIEEIFIAPPAAGEILVKVRGAGLCHSDLNAINGTSAPVLPLVFGHEGAGEVLEVGSAVRDVAIGDHVVFQFAASCGRCVYCLEGRPQICTTAAAAAAKGELMGGGSRFRDAAGNTLAHYSGVSCFSEYTVVDRGSVVVVDRTFPLDRAALLGCAVMTGVGAILNTARVRAGESVAVIGLGGVGASALLGARLCGAATIIGMDIDETKFERAKALGVTHVFNPKDETCVEAVRDATQGGVHFAFEFAGAVPAMRTALAVVRRGGSVIMAGLPKKGAELGFDPGGFVREEKALRGSFMGSCVPVRDIPRFIRLEQDGKLPIGNLIDRFIGFDGLNEGFDLLERGKVLRQVLVPGMA
ncbi:zinc-binding dehydrogenase [Pseudogemmobacter sonorensis]|uniref:zinc-binding dehydrogenase n=1 Tax=Pseudogemmobacter sonorensis TaxID=2989681 RepID=UPI00369E5A2F